MKQASKAQRQTTYSGEEWEEYQSPSLLEARPTQERGDKMSIPAADALHALRHDRMLTRAARKVPFPIIYFALYMFMVVTHIPSSRLFKQSRALDTNLATKGDTTVTAQTPIQFFNIQTQNDVLDWMENTLVPAVFVSTDSSGQDLNEWEYGKVAVYNQIVGALRITTIESIKVDCTNQDFLNALYPTCHDRKAENETSYYISAFAPLDYAREQFQFLRNDSWINDQTMEVIVEVITYNGEIDSYSVTTLELKIQEGGFIEMESHTVACKASTYSGAKAYVVDVLVLACLAFVVGRQIRDLWRNRYQLVEHLVNFWSIIDYASTALITAFYVIWGIRVSITLDSQFEDSIATLGYVHSDRTLFDNPNELISVLLTLKRVARLVVVLRLLSTTTVLLLGIRILGRFHFHPRLNVLSQTIGGSLSRFSSFFIVCAIVIVTFAMAGHIIFGDHTKEFASIAGALKSCVNILFGNFDYSIIDGLHGPVSIIFYWLYTVVATLVLLNMTLAIVLATYEDVSEKAFRDTAVTSLRRMSYIVVYDVLLWFHNVRGGVCCRKGSSRKSRMASLQEDGTSALVRRDAVFLGRIRPDVLESVFTRLVFPDGDGFPSQAPIDVTPESLQRVFARADVSDSEARATIEYLKNGLMPERLTDDAAGDGAERKRSLLGSLAARRALTSTDAAPARDAEIQQLRAQVAALELKLERRLDLLLARLPDARHVSAS